MANDASTFGVWVPLGIWWLVRWYSHDLEATKGAGAPKDGEASAASSLLLRT